MGSRLRAREPLCVHRSAQMIHLLHETYSCQTHTSSTGAALVSYLTSE